MPFPAYTGRGRPAALPKPRGFGAGRTVPPGARLPLAQVAVRVEHELRRRAGVEFRVALRRVLQGNRLRVDVLGDMHPVMQDGHHQLPVVLHDRTLSRGEAEGLGPARSEAERERTFLRGLVHAARVPGDVESGDAQGTARGRYLHQRVQYGGGGLVRARAVALGLEAHGIHATVHLRHAEDLLDLLRRTTLGEVH